MIGLGVLPMRLSFRGRGPNILPKLGLAFIPLHLGHQIDIPPRLSHWRWANTEPKQELYTLLSLIPVTIQEWRASPEHYFSMIGVYTVDVDSQLY